jgi:hypothetical protein
MIQPVSSFLPLSSANEALLYQFLKHGDLFLEGRMSHLTLLHKSERPPKSLAVTGSTIAEIKQRPSGCLFRLKPFVEGFYTQHVWRTSLLFEESLPSHGDGQDFQDSTCVEKCQCLTGSFASEAHSSDFILAYRKVSSQY